MIYGAAEITPEEFEHLVAMGQLTALAHPIAAKPAHELLLDEEGQHYEPFVHARDRLRRIADEKINQAHKSLCAGDLEGAERLTAIAIRADDNRHEPFALRAAIRMSRGKTNEVAVMKLLAPPTVGDTAFRALVDYYFCCLPPSSNALGTAPNAHGPLPSSRRPMRGVALQKPALAPAA
jgi:hypothetical protein